MRGITRRFLGSFQRLTLDARLAYSDSSSYLVSWKRARGARQARGVVAGGAWGDLTVAPGTRWTGLTASIWGVRHESLSLGAGQRQQLQNGRSLFKHLCYS